MTAPGLTLNPALGDLKAALDGRAAAGSVPDDVRPGAVMVLFTGPDDRPELILTRRSQHVNRHRGEIAFPGGKPEPSDESLLDTAIRETTEELGVPREAIEVWGELEPVLTVSTGFGLSVHTGKLRDTTKIAVDHREIEALLPVPMATVLDPGSFRNETRIVDGEPVQRPTYSYNGDIVWGATARIVAQLIEAVRPGPQEQLGEIAL